jgi:DNA-binding transcriptional MocR family regulator
MDLINRYRRRDEIIPFQNGIPAFNEFPVKIWQRLINQAAQNFSSLHLGYGEAAMIFAGIEIFPSPLDNEGLDLNYSTQNNPRPDLIFTTPSHQFPLGLTI